MAGRDEVAGWCGKDVGDTATRMLGQQRWEALPGFRVKGDRGRPLELK
jgi:hypothetical protein